MVHIRQEPGSRHCGSACLAMLTNLPYAKATAHHLGPRGFPARYLAGLLRALTREEWAVERYSPPYPSVDAFAGRRGACLVRLGPRRTHWIVINGAWLHDPALPYPQRLSASPTAAASVKAAVWPA